MGKINRKFCLKIQSFQQQLVSRLIYFFYIIMCLRVNDIKIKQENRLRQIMNMTPGESAKDKGTLFLELREICSYFHSEYSQSQVFF
jgi:hypothetical protein